MREAGAWEDWLDFFLNGVYETATQATEAATRILALFKEDRARVADLGRSASSALRVFDHLQARPFLSIPKTAGALGLSVPTVTKALQALEGLSVVREATGRQRGRLYVYPRYLEILSEGTEPLRRG